MNSIERDAYSNSSVHGQLLLSNRCLALTGKCIIQFSKLLMALASTVILRSESHGTLDNILFSDDSGTLRPNGLVHKQKLGIYRPTYRLFYTTRIVYIYHDAFNNFHFLAVIFAAEMCLPSRCLATIGGYT
jgi:hypothetical protein